MLIMKELDDVVKTLNSNYFKEQITYSFNRLLDLENQVLDISRGKYREIRQPKFERKAIYGSAGGNSATE